MRSKWRAVVGICEFHDACDGRTLRRLKTGMPRIEDQHDAWSVAIVCGFVLDRVVKYESFTRAPFAALCPDTKPAIFWHDKW